MLKNLFFSIFLFSAFSIFAQSNGDEDEMFFIYSTGSIIANKESKVLIISSHIMGFKGNKFNFNILNSLSFGDIIEKIEYNESIIAPSYDYFTFGSPTIEYLWGNYMNWHPETTRKNDLVSEDSILSALEKIRRNIIEEYKNDGYLIYQIDYNPLEDETIQLRVEYYETELFRRSPISPLWVPFYQKGELKNIAQNIKDNKGISGGLVVETKEQSSTKNSSKRKQKEEDDSEKWERQAQMNMWRANLLEEEADILYNKGALYISQALAKYQKAQKLYPTARVQQKIDSINSFYVLAEVLDKTGEAVDNLVYDLDSEEKTRRTYLFVKYSGLYGDFSKLSNPDMQSSRGGVIGLSLSRLFITWEVRGGYMETPILEYNLRAGGFQPNPSSYSELVQIQGAMITGGTSIGINIPLKSFMVYAMYGGDFGEAINSNVLTEGFRTDEIPRYPSWWSKFTIGTVVDIPKTKLSLGINYDFISAKGIAEGDGNSQVIKESSPSAIIYLDSTTDEKLKYGFLGVGLFFNL